MPSGTDASSSRLSSSSLLFGASAQPTPIREAVTERFFENLGLGQKLAALTPPPERELGTHSPARRPAPAGRGLCCAPPCDPAVFQSGEKTRPRLWYDLSV